MIRRSIPTLGCLAPELRLLLKAYACPMDQARLAWREWLATRSITDASWAEVRLLSALAGRMPLIDPNSPERPLLDGIRRFVWTRNQARLDHSMVVIDLLINSGITVMVLKGMARIAANPRLASARYVRDIDIMIESSRIDDACNVLLSNGWRPRIGKLPGKSRAESFSRLLSENPGETAQVYDEDQVDIHRGAIHFGNTGTYDDIFWTRAQDALLRGRAVKIPSDTDQFLHAIAHGAVYDADRPADWVIDALEASKASNFNWEICATEMQRRHVGAAVANSLEFLEYELGLEIPENIYNVQKRCMRNPLYKVEAAAYRKPPEQRSQLNKQSMRFAEWIRSRHCIYQPKLQRTTLWKGQRFARVGKSNLVAGRTLITTPIAKYKINSDDLLPDCQLVIDILMEKGATCPAHFDLLVNHVWFGRLRLKHLRRRYNIAVPQDVIGKAKNCDLFLVLLNQKGQVPAKMPFQIAVGLAPAGKPVVPPKLYTFEQIFS